ARLVEQPLGCAEIEPGESGPAERGYRPELDDACDAHSLDRTTRLHADRLPDAEVLALRRGPVDDHLVLMRPGTGHEGQPAEVRLRRVAAETEVRRAPERDGLAVAADQVRVARDESRRGAHLGQSADRGEQGLVERRRRAAVAAAQRERRFPGDG